MSNYNFLSLMCLLGCIGSVSAGEQSGPIEAQVASEVIAPEVSAMPVNQNTLENQALGDMALPPLSLSEATEILRNMSPEEYTNIMNSVRNMTPEQQKVFDNQLKALEDMYGIGVTPEAGDFSGKLYPGVDHDGNRGMFHNMADVMNSDGKLLSLPTGKKNSSDTDGYVIEELKKLVSFSDLVGGVPDGVALTAMALKEHRATRAVHGASTDEHEENASYRLLLYGPPGTGKTIIAEAFAREIGAAFMRVKGTEFVDGYIATGKQRIMECFKKARDYGEPIVVFIDEIDAIARERTKERNDEYANTLIALIQELDQCEREAGDRVFVILATNMFSTLDAALRSRFSNTAIEIKTPSSSLGMQIMEHYLKKNKHGYELLSKPTLWWIKFWTRGFAGRDYRNMINKAKLYAKNEKITKEHLLKAMNEAYASRTAGEKDKDSWIKKMADKYGSPWSSTMSAITYTGGAVGVAWSLYYWLRPTGGQNMAQYVTMAQLMQFMEIMQANKGALPAAQAV